MISQKEKRVEMEKQVAILEAATAISAILDPLDWDQKKIAVRVALAQHVPAWLNMVLKFESD